MTKTTSSANVNVGPYEIMMILNPDLRESEVKKHLADFEEALEKSGGKIAERDFWGKRALAYRLKRKDEGIYMIYNAELPAKFIKELKEMLRIDKELLRSLVIKLPVGHKYTKFDLTLEPKESKRDFMYKKPMNVSVKHSGTVKSVKPKEAVEDKGQEANKVDLEKKLDEIIGGGDLKL